VSPAPGVSCARLCCSLGVLDAEVSRGPYLAGLAQQRLHGRGEGVVQGVDGVHLAEPDQRVLRRQAVQEHVLDLVQPRRRPQRRALVEVRLRRQVGFMLLAGSGGGKLNGMATS